MTNPSHLNDDSDQWPDDPFALLGVARSVSAKDARRAYVKLLRVFTPDDSPAEFQRIRAAYEAVVFHIEWHSDDEETEHDAIDNGLPCAAASRDDFDASDEDADVFSTRLPVEQDHLQTFWDAAQRGEIENARGELALIPTGTSQHAAGQLANYFLRVTEDRPNDHEASLARLESLVHILSESYHLYDVTQQLQSEFDRYPMSSLRNPIDELLRTSKRWEVVAAVARLRWQAITWENAETVVRDVEMLQEEFSIEQQWPYLLADSLEYTMFSRIPRAVEHTRNVWHALTSDVAAINDHHIDDMENLRLAADSFQRVSQVVIGSRLHWIELAPYCRTDLPRTRVRRWQRVLEAFPAPIDVHRTLVMFQDLFQQAPLAMELVRYGAMQLYDESPTYAESPDWQQYQEAVSHFLASRPHWNYADDRERVLRFCVDNRIAPLAFSHFADQVTTQAVADYASWADVINYDGSLQCAFAACTVMD